MNEKKSARLRRAKRTRSKINQLRMKRLCVYRTPRHIYAQIISEQGDRIIACASTVEKENRKNNNLDHRWPKMEEHIGLKKK